MNILVTGGAGYIGSMLVPKLLADGFKVTVIDNFMYKQTSLATSFQNPNFKMVYGDVRDKSSMSILLAQADVIIPLAAIVGAPACDKDYITAETTNKEAMLWLIRNVSTTQRIIMPTTNSAYGSGDQNNFCDENSPLNPLSLYAKDKVIVENELMNLPNATSFRLATVFGLSPRMRLDLLVNNFVYRALSDGFIVVFEGYFKRNYIHIQDVVDTFIFAIKNEQAFKNQIFNVGLSEANLSKLELCHEIKKIVPSLVFLEAPFGKDPDQRNYVVSNQKIESLGFKPMRSLQQGLRELVAGIKMYDQKLFTNI
jgi:nucleoside-diphosphate-sugar epimerase